ncbi:MAG: hypothetical protein LQ347_006400 [Umbilicaria vellea]|nr:MAG: hypothetical protein LQ347_006400 [Umbilicaria vellea]
MKHERAPAVYVVTEKMGYSLAPAPDTQVPSLSGNSRAVSPSILKEKSFQPRAELAPIPSRVGEEVTEIVSFLNSVEPPKPPETHLYSTNSKLRKSTLGTLWRIGRFSTKRQEQLRAALPKPTRDDETIAGAKYLHIAVDPSAFKSSGNLSMYRANEYRDPAQKRMTGSLTPTVPSETPTAVETTGSSAETPTIPQSQSFQLSDALGISREYPHLISGEPKTKAGGKPGKPGANTVSSSDTLVPRHDIDVSITKDFAIHSSNVRFELIPAESLRGREFVPSGSANSSVLDLNVVPPRTSSRSLRQTFNRQIGPTAVEVRRVHASPRPSRLPQQYLAAEATQARSRTDKIAPFAA